MNITTKFTNGDIVYSIQKEFRTDSWSVIGPMTIGQVRVEITNSDGIEGECVFDNYMEQHGRKEQYMCVETGVGTGTLHDADLTFYHKCDAENEKNSRNSELDLI